MARFAVLAVAAALLVFGASAAFASKGGPVTQQNGKTPVFKAFTSICAVPGYVNYGNCAGDPTTYTEVTGKVNAVQAKAGVWNLGISFSNLEPGRYYRLWGNRTGSTPAPGEIDGFFVIGTAVAALDGTAKFSYRTSQPTYLGFDLNILDDPEQLRGITVVTSYWSEQALQVLNPDGTLFVPGS
jgi:hypothetical protein